MLIAWFCNFTQGSYTLKPLNFKNFFKDFQGPKAWFSRTYHNMKFDTLDQVNNKTDLHCALYKLVQGIYN